MSVHATEKYIPLGKTEEIFETIIESISETNNIKIFIANDLISQLNPKKVDNTTIQISNSQYVLNLVFNNNGYYMFTGIPDKFNYSSDILKNILIVNVEHRKRPILNVE